MSTERLLRLNDKLRAYADPHQYRPRETRDGSISQIPEFYARDAAGKGF